VVKARGYTYAPSSNGKTDYAVVGNGSMTSCTPATPYACSTEAYLYVLEADRWQVVGVSKKNNLCPPPLRAVTAAYHCKSGPEGFYYYMDVVGTAVADTTDSGHKASPTAQYFCI
jgi:hypothetical protein